MTRSANDFVMLGGDAVALVDDRPTLPADKLGVGTQPFERPGRFCSAVWAGDFKFKGFWRGNLHRKIQT